MKKILFVCVENAGRSKMAEAFLKNVYPTDLNQSVQVQSLQ